MSQLDELEAGNAIDELGYTTREMALMTEVMRVRGQEVEDRKKHDDGPELLAAFRQWKAIKFDVEYAAVIKKHHQAKKDVLLSPIQCAKSDFDGEKVTMPSVIKTATKRTQYAYLLKLHAIHKGDEVGFEPNPLAIAVGQAYLDVEKETDFDTTIRNSDEYKKL